MRGRGVSRAKWEPKKGLDRMVIPLEEGRITLQRRAFEIAEGQTVERDLQI